MAEGISKAGRRVAFIALALGVAAIACDGGGRGGGGPGGGDGSAGGDSLVDQFLAEDEREERFQCLCECECEGAPLQECVEESLASAEGEACFRRVFANASQEALEHWSCRLEVFRESNDCLREAGCIGGAKYDCEEQADRERALCPWVPEVDEMLIQLVECPD